MLTVAILHLLSAERMVDARSLLAAGRNEGAIYLCGYAIELALKARICETLNWIRFPEAGKEASDYRSLRTHDLDVLLYLSGLHEQIAEGMKQDWIIVVKWNPELRYSPPGADPEMPSAEAYIPAAERILEAL